MTDLRARMLSGEPLLGVFVDSGSPVAAEVVAGAGGDWMVLDAEHGVLGPGALLPQLQALRGAPAAPVIRVPGPRSELIGWALDAGAAGVMVPRVDTVGDVRDAVAASRYAEDRGAAPGVRAAAYGRDPGYLAAADERRALLVQIETAPALAAVEEIAAVDGVDALFLGPNDLARSLGLLGAPADHPEVLAAGDRIGTAAREHGKAAGVFVGDPSHAPAYRERGFTVIASGSDVGLLRAAVDARLAELRGLLG